MWYLFRSNKLYDVFQTAFKVTPEVYIHQLNLRRYKKNNYVERHKIDCLKIITFMLFSSSVAAYFKGCPGPSL